MSFFSGGSGKVISDRTKKGFLKSDIEALKLFGRTQASASGKKIDVGELKSKINERTAREKITTKSGFRSGPDFEDIAEDVSQEEVERMFNIFQKRSENIKERSTRPGVKQTRLVDR